VSSPCLHAGRTLTTIAKTMLMMMTRVTWRPRSRAKGRAHRSLRCSAGAGAGHRGREHPSDQSVCLSLGALVRYPVAQSASQFHPTVKTGQLLRANK
jgi:hypothetical protein